MSNLFQDHVAAFGQLLEGEGLIWYDGQVPDAPSAQYVLVYAYFETPDGLAAPDAVPLTYVSRALDVRMYLHCVSPTAQGARATAARVRGAALDTTPVVAGRTCFPVRWREGQPARRDEEVPGLPVHDLVDVYGWRSVPA